MSTAAIVETLRLAESHHHQNLITLLGTVKGSRSPETNGRLPSIIRGLCTHNQKLLSLCKRCLDDIESPEDMEPFKTFVTDFILWHDISFVVFEKYLNTVSFDDEAAHAPIVHCNNYVEFAASASSLIRNPFVAEKLNEISARALQLLDQYNVQVTDARLNNITFDHVQAFGGSSVSCFFNVEQISNRTKDATIHMGDKRVELVMLRHESGSESHAKSMAILEVLPQNLSRSVLYPPFRVNELKMSLSGNCITFSAVDIELLSGGETSSNQSFSVTGSGEIIHQWYNDLKSIFPTDEKLVDTKSVQLSGLGINTVSDSSNDDLPMSSTPSTSDGLIKDTPATRDSCSSFKIMKKTLSFNGMEPEDIVNQPNLYQSPEHESISAEIDYENDDVSDLDSIECFDIITPAAAKNLASASLPDLSAAPPAVPTVYNNTAGSAIDITNFGKDYNPSFTSLEIRPQSNARKSSFFNKLRSKFKPANESVKPTKAQSSATEENKQAESIAENSDSKQKESEKLETKPVATKKKGPDLKIEIPPPIAHDASQPSSAVSSSRPLPSPFALPSSTSTYFFKPYMQGNGSSSGVNSSSVSLVSPEEPNTLSIPQDLKDIINSEDTIDFYMSPTSPKSLKVSKWKPKYGKWELLSVSDTIFIKIAVNYDVFKAWLLVFREEYDSESDEIVDIPLVILDLDANSSVRQSSALDVELISTNAITKKKSQNIIRCFESSLVDDVLSNLNNVSEMMTSKSGKNDSSFGSNMTLASSVLSKPSTSSTLASLYSHNDQKVAQSSSLANSLAKQGSSSSLSGEQILLDRMKVKVYKQMESYQKIQQLSSWKALDMYTLFVSHSTSKEDAGSYHFKMTSSNPDLEEESDIEWVFSHSGIHEKLERIGKAGILVKVSKDELYMIECKGKKELKRLVSLF